MGDDDDDATDEEASDDDDSKNNMILNTPMIPNVNNNDNNDNDAVDTWKRRMKIQALALQEAEDALERAEGEIQLANEINYQKNTNQDNNFQNFPDITSDAVDRNNINTVTNKSINNISNNII